LKGRAGQFVPRKNRSIRHDLQHTSI
jgi:hypothetical protein